MAIQTAADLRDVVKKAMLESVPAQRVIDKACRTPKAASVGKCIDVEFLKHNLSKMGVRAPADVVDDLFNSLDPDGDGVVDYHAFLKSVCGKRTADFLRLMQNLHLSDTVRETKLRKAARRKRLQEAAAAEISDPFELLKAKINAGQGSNNFRQAFRKFKCRTAQHINDETIDFRGFKNALVSLGIELSDQKMRRVFNVIDKDGSRLIDFVEFRSAIEGEEVTKSGVKDWKTEVARMRWKQQEAYNDAATMMRTPTALYTTLRNLFVGQKNAHKAFRKFLHLSGSADTFLDVQEIKKSLNEKRIKCAPSVVERLFKHLDPNDDGQITFTEFTKAFIDIDMTQLSNLDLPPRAVRSFNKKKPMPKSIDPSSALKQLRQAMKERGTLRGLQLAFHRNRCDWKSVRGGAGVDIRGFMDALQSKGIALPPAVVKGSFFALDDNNVGVLSYAQFRNAVQDSIPQVPDSARSARQWVRSRPGTAASMSPSIRSKARGVVQTPTLKLKRSWSRPGPATDPLPRRGNGKKAARLPTFRDISSKSPSQAYSKRDLSIAFAATSRRRARQIRKQRDHATGSIYRNPYN